jgi:glutamate/tyrosine decarboxylase-like PLP-dependent enzyme
MTDLELSDDQRRALGEAALAWVLQYFTSASTSPVYPSVSATELSDLVGEPLPRVPQHAMSVLDQFARLAALGRKNGHSRMFGYVQSSGNFAGTIGDFLASALNQNVTSWRSAPAATAIELQVLDWIKTLVGCNAFGGGVLVGGGSAANLAGLATALRASTAVDVHAHGVRALPGAPVIYASDRVHMSVPKAAALLGLGRESVCLIPSDATGRLPVNALRARVAQDRGAGKHPVAVVANAGEVNAGAVDPLDAIADLCEAERVWLHIDGAYGGFAAAVPAVERLFAGLTRADSLSLDPHKWLFVPLDLGCLLVRDLEALRRAFAHRAAYIDVVAERDMSEYAFWDVSPELSRRFRALKLWFALKCHGADAFTAAIARNIDLARHLADAIDAAEDFERLAPAPLSIVCFRYAPAALANDERALNDLNRRLLVDIQRDGDSYVSNASIGDTFALRACIVNHRTTAEDVGLLLATIRRLGRARMSGPR